MSNFEKLALVWIFGVLVGSFGFFVYHVMQDLDYLEERIDDTQDELERIETFLKTPR